MLQHQIMMIKLQGCSHVHCIISVDHQMFIIKVMVQHIKDEECHKIINVKLQNDDGATNEIPLCLFTFGPMQSYENVIRIVNI